MQALDGRGPNPWLVFTLVCIPILIGSIDLTSIVVVLPQATLDLLGVKGLSRASQALWAVTAYLLAYTVSLAVVGRLSDTVSRKRIFIVCIVIFIIGCLWAGLATDLPLTLLRALPIWPDPDMLPLISLVIGRVIQAIGAGASVSVGMALVSDIFPPEHRAEPISLIGAIDSLGWVIGNLFAGVLLQVLPSWRWLFFINGAIAFLALIATVLILRRVETPATPGRFDWRGAALFAGALTALTIGIELLNKPETTTYIVLGVAALLLIVFVISQRRSRQGKTESQPLIDLKFIRQPEVAAALITNILIGFALILVVAGIPVMINLRAVFLRGEGLLTGALRAGIMLCALTIPLVGAVLIGEGRYRRVGVAIPVSLGLFLAGVGFLLTRTWGYSAENWIIALPLTLIGVGLGLTIGPLSLVVVEAADENARGLASSLVLTMRLLGMTFGTPIAAALTLNLANQWATEAASGLPWRYAAVARAMLVPPKTTEALILVMMIGAAACTFGLLFLYLPRAIQTIQARRLQIGAILNGVPILIVITFLVALIAFTESRANPATLSNSVAYQMPPNVEFYAGFSIQQLFLEQNWPPLDSSLSLVDSLVATPAPQVTATPGEPTVESTPDTPSQSPTEEPDTAPAEDSVTDTVIKRLFRPAVWNDEQYLAFCNVEGIPAEEAEWRCFNDALASWLGPQGGLGILPKTREDADFVFAFQATNRSSAISFLYGLARAFNVTPPVSLSPNVDVITLNPGTRDERRVAITDAYVLVGTPQAVDYTLNHGSQSLIDVPQFQSLNRELTGREFATVYVKSASFDSDIGLTLNSILGSGNTGNLFRSLNGFSSLFFPRTTDAPTIFGMALRLDGEMMRADVTANLPYSLNKLNAIPLPGVLISSTMQNAAIPAWMFANFNLAGLIRDVDIDQTVDSALSANPTAAQLADTFGVRTQLVQIGHNLQALFSHAHGQFGVTTNQKSGDGLFAVSMLDRADQPIARDLNTLIDSIRALPFVLGVQIADQQTELGRSVKININALAQTLPDGLTLLLTPENVLILSTGDVPDPAMIRTMRNLAVSTEAEGINENGTNDFLRALVRPAVADYPSVITLQGYIERQTVRFSVIIQPMQDAE